MIHWVWCLVTFMLGGGLGCVATSLCVVSARYDRAEEKKMKGGDEDEEAVYYAGKPKD